jgi:hypothetical protein
MRIDRITDLPELRGIGSDNIFYRFTIDDYLIAIEVTGHLVKFLRVLPKPRL